MHALVEELRQSRHRRVVEHQRRGQRQTGGRAQPIPQLQGHQRIESGVGERACEVDLLGAAVSEHDGDLLPHEVPQRTGPAGGVEVRAPPARGHVRVVLSPVLPGRTDLGDLVEEPAVPCRGVHGGEPRPVHVGDHHRRARRAERVCHPGDGVERIEHADTSGGQRCVARVVGHAGAAPRPPVHRAGGHAVGTPALRPGVQHRVGRGVRAVLPRSPHRGDGGEVDDPVQVLRGERGLQVLDSGHLGRQAVREVGDARVREGSQHPRSRRVHNGADEFAVRLDVLDQGGDRRAIGQVARGDRGAGTVCGQISHHVLDTGCVGAPAADQHHVLRAVAAEPSGDVGGEGTGAAGHQHGPSWTPRFTAGRHPHDAAAEHGVGPQRHLVLAPFSAEDTGQLVDHLAAHLFWQVDQPTPAVGVFKRGGAPQCPHRGLAGVCRTGVAGHTDGTARGTPQRRGDSDLAQCPNQREGEGETCRHLRVRRVRGAVHAHQGQHSADSVAHPTDPFHEVPGTVDEHRDSPVPQRLHDRGDRPVVALPLRGHDQPGAGRRGSPGLAGVPVGQCPPPHAVAIGITGDRLRPEPPVLEGIAGHTGHPRTGRYRPANVHTGHPQLGQ